MDNIVLHLKLVRGMRGIPLAYVVWCHIKVAHISPGYGTYPNLDKEIIARDPIINSRSSLKLSQDSLDRAYLDHQCDTFNIDNALVYQILSNIFMDMDAYVYVKQKKGCRMIKQCSLKFTSNFLALIMWPDRLQKQKKSYKTTTTMVRKKSGIGTSMLHFTKNSMPSWTGLQIIATVAWTVAPKFATFSKASTALSWRLQSMLFGPNQKSMAQILMLPCLTWAK